MLQATAAQYRLQSLRSMLAPQATLAPRATTLQSALSLQAALAQVPQAMLQGLQMLLAAATLQSLQTALAHPVQPALRRLQVLQALRPCPPPHLPLQPYMHHLRTRLS